VPGAPSHCHDGDPHGSQAPPAPHHVSVRVYDCPFGTGSPRQLTSMQLTFRTTPGGPMVASLTAAYANCQHVWITVGAQVLWLGDYTASGQDLQQQVLTIAHVRWP
jgi:hypothetical protein